MDSSSSSLRPNTQAMTVGLAAFNWEADTSLALWNLIAYARLEPRVRDSVDFHQFCEPTPKTPWEEEIALRRFLTWVGTLKPNVLGLSCYIWNVDFLLKVAKAVKTLYPEILVVFGGQQVRGKYVRHLLERERCVDLCVVGEGELPFRDLMLFLVTGEPGLDVIGGLAFLVDEATGELHRADADGNLPAAWRLRQTGDAPRIENLVDIPSPFLGEFPLPRNGAFLFEASRDCPFRCAYCAWGERGSLREYPMERVEAELTRILAHAPSHIMFCDGTFNLRPERALRILRLLIAHLREGLVEPFSLLLEMKLELIDAEMAAALDELAGLNPLVTFEFGLQSTGPEATRLIRRGFSEKRFRSSWSLLSDRLKSSAIVDCIYGLPGDGVADFMNTVDFCYSLAPHRIQCFRLTILPGTDLDRRSEELNLTYLREPPHMVLETRWVSFEELGWLETFGFAVADLYHFHSTTIKALLGMGGRLGLAGFSRLVAGFCDWAGAERILGSSYAGNRPEGRWRAIDLSGLFRDYLFQSLLPGAGLDDPSIIERLADLFNYENHLGRIAVRGIRQGTLAGSLMSCSEIMESRYDIPAFVVRARGRTAVDILELAEKRSHIAFTQKAGHQGVMVPISYRVGAEAATLISQLHKGDQVDADNPGRRRLIDSLISAGLILPSPQAIPSPGPFRSEAELPIQ